MVHAGVGGVQHPSDSGGGSSSILLVSSARVGVVVYPRVPGEFVGPTEALRASRESACMWLLACVGANVARLMLKTVESLLTQRALVRPRQVLALPLLFLAGLVVLEERRH